jgi:beta-lactam-binding protein with PASTA domain
VRTRLLVVLAVAASLTACGGGGSHKSSGGGPKVPNLVGKNWSDATDQLSLAGIPYISQSVAGTESSTAAPETDFEVCSTKPKAGEPLGTDITMFIAPKGKC